MDDAAQNDPGQELKKLEEELKNIGTPQEVAPSAQVPAGNPPPPPPPAETVSKEPIASVPPPPAQMQPKGSKILMVAIVLLVLSLVGLSAYFLGSKNPASKACTQDAKICPDGSSVGRVGRNCEFAQCPTPIITPLETEESSPTPTATGSAVPSGSPTASPSVTPTATPSATPQ